MLLLSLLSSILFAADPRSGAEQQQQTGEDKVFALPGEDPSSYGPESTESKEPVYSGGLEPFSEDYRRGFGIEHKLCPTCHESLCIQGCGYPEKDHIDANATFDAVNNALKTENNEGASKYPCGMGTTWTPHSASCSGKAENPVAPSDTSAWTPDNLPDFKQSKLGVQHELCPTCHEPLCIQGCKYTEDDHIKAHATFDAINEALQQGNGIGGSKYACGMGKTCTPHSVTCLEKR